MQEQGDMRNGGKAQLTTGKPILTYETKLNAIGDSLGDLASSEDEKVGVDKDDDEYDTELSKLSEDDEPGWVMGIVSEMIQHGLESFWEKQMMLDDLTRLG